MATILVVDDQQPIRELLVTFLSYAGHHLLEASDGAEALGLVRARRPDLVITDILMPTMDGYEFVRQLRTDAAVAATPVIFYSAMYQQREALALAQACGVSHIVTKPADLEVIYQTIEAALAGKPAPIAPVAPASAEEFDREHLRLLTDKVAQEVDELRTVNARLTALIEVSRQLGLEHDPRRLLEKFCHAARDILGAKYAAIGLLEPGGRNLSPFLISGLDALTAAGLGAPSPAEGLLGDLLRANRPGRFRDLSREPSAVDFLLHFPPVCSFLGVPIASTSQLFGVLCLTDKLGAEEFTAEDESVAVALAAQLAVACENAGRYEEVQRNLRRLEHEMTERRQVEEALRTNEERLARIVETIADGILFLDLEGRITFANSTAERIIGRPREELVGCDYRTWAWKYTLTDGTLVTPETSFFTRVMATRQEVYGEERVIERADGARVIVSCNATPIRDAAGALTGVLGSFTDITDRRQAEEARQEYTERLKSLSQQLLKAQEVERRHIARELHDEIGQSLTAVKINLQALQRNPGTASMAPRLEESIGIVERTLEQVRNLSLDLRPSILDDLGLVAALRWYLDRQARRSGFAAHITAEPLLGALVPELETACFRVVQEALTNVARHAKARHVRVELRPTPDALYVMVADDGVGFDPDAARERAARGDSLGLLGMQERVMLLGGQIELASAHGRGTQIQVCFPLAGSPQTTREEQGRVSATAARS